MSALHLLPIGKVPPQVLADLGEWLGRRFDLSCKILDGPLDPTFALHRERGQYHSTQILARMRECVTPECWRLLGVTELDLYIPILTFVFGEAEVGGHCAVISLHRLRQEFYGLAPDEELTRSRVRKEAAHELGHVLGLTHCDDYGCLMAPSHAVEWVDLKGEAFCDACRSAASAPVR